LLFCTMYEYKIMVSILRLKKKGVFLYSKKKIEILFFE